MLTTRVSEYKRELEQRQAKSSIIMMGIMLSISALYFQIFKHLKCERSSHFVDKLLHDVSISHLHGHVQRGLAM